MRNLLLYPVVILALCCAGCGTSSDGNESTDSSTGPTLSQTSDELTISVAGRPVLTYRISDTLPPPTATDTTPDYYRRSGFIHPAYSPAGKVVTDGFPAGHTHQHGIFTAWTKTTFRGEFHDFWNQHKELATVEHVEILGTYDSTDVAGFSARLQQVSLRHGPVLEDIWNVRVLNSVDPYVWELRSEQTNVSNDTLFLEKHLYGGLGIRGSATWNSADSSRYVAAADFLTSEGLGRDSANHTRPEWTAIYGPEAGLAVIPHPDNFRGLHFVRAHPEMPYMSVTPVVEEGFFIPPGGRYTARYRFVVFDGEPDAELLNSHRY